MNASPFAYMLPHGSGTPLLLFFILDRACRGRRTSVVSCAGQADAMAKPTAAKNAASKNKQPQKEPSGQPALRWQLGGLIAGVAVAILSSTQPGKEVRCSTLQCAPCALFDLVYRGRSSGRATRAVLTAYATQSRNSNSSSAACRCPVSKRLLVSYLFWCNFLLVLYQKMSLSAGQAALFFETGYHSDSTAAARVYTHRWTCTARNREAQSRESNKLRRYALPSRALGILRSESFIILSPTSPFARVVSNGLTKTTLPLLVHRCTAKLLNAGALNTACRALNPAPS